MSCRALGVTVLVIIACLSGLYGPAPGAVEPATKRPLAATKAAIPPTIDGDLSDPCWQTCPKAERFYDRQQGAVAPDQTTAWLVYDDKNIYVAFYCRDSQPDRIVARETVRDQKYQGNGNDSEDNVEVTFDPFLSRRDEDFARFSVNPLGTPSAQITGGRAAKAEWRGDWDAAAKRVSDGWTCEMRIPWRILSYPSGRRALTMGVNFWRWQDRTKIQSVWSNVGQQGFNDLEGLWTNVQVPGGVFHRTLSLLPYTLPGLYGLNHTFRSGMDARYTLTPELTAVGTLNPDFGTIEGAVASIQFSRSEQFVPERRPFFLEGGDFFSAGDYYALGPYFYPNRIPAFDIGTKVYGKITPADTLGFLSTVEGNNRSDVVSRYMHSLSDTSSVGLFFAQKSARDDNNTVGVLMQNARWGKFGIGSQWGIATGQSAGGAAKQVNWTYSDTNNFTSLQYLDVSPLFRDADGLIFFNDYRGFALYNDWSAVWRRGFWRDFDVSLFPTYNWHTDGRPFQRGGGLSVTFDARADWRVGLDVYYQRFDDQTDNTFTVRFRQGVSNRFRQWGLQVQVGRLADRPSSFFGPSFSVRVLRRLDLIYGAGIQELDGRTQQHILTVNYEVSPTRSFGGRIVVQNGDTNWYVSFRHSGEKGTETFFILGDPNALRFTRRAAIKFVFAI